MNRSVSRVRRNSPASYKLSESWTSGSPSNDEFRRRNISRHCHCVATADVKDSKYTHILYTVTRRNEPSISGLIAGHGGLGERRATSPNIYHQYLAAESSCTKHFEYNTNRDNALHVSALELRLSEYWSRVFELFAFENASSSVGYSSRRKNHI